MPLLLTSRIEEYKAAVAARTDVLTAAVSIALEDITVTDLADYLPLNARKTTTGNSSIVSDWDPVMIRLVDDRTARQLKTSPQHCRPR